MNDATQPHDCVWARDASDCPRTIFDCPRTDAARSDWVERNVGHGPQTGSESIPRISNPGRITFADGVGVERDCVFSGDVRVGRELEISIFGTAEPRREHAANGPFEHWPELGGDDTPNFRRRVGEITSTRERVVSRTQRRRGRTTKTTRNTRPKQCRSS